MEWAHEQPLQRDVQGLFLPMQQFSEPSGARNPCGARECGERRSPWSLLARSLQVNFVAVRTHLFFFGECGTVTFLALLCLSLTPALTSPSIPAAHRLPPMLA